MAECSRVLIISRSLTARSPTLMPASSKIGQKGSFTQLMEMIQIMKVGEVGFRKAAKQHCRSHMGPGSAPRRADKVRAIPLWVVDCCS